MKQFDIKARIMPNAATQFPYLSLRAPGPNQKNQHSNGRATVQPTIPRKIATRFWRRSYNNLLRTIITSGVKNNRHPKAVGFTIRFSI